MYCILFIWCKKTKKKQKKTIEDSFKYLKIHHFLLNSLVLKIEKVSMYTDKQCVKKVVREMKAMHYKCFIYGSV